MFDKIVVPTDFSTATDEDLNSLETQVRTAAAPLVARANGEGEPLNAEETAGIQRLSEVVTNVRSERERRIGEASAAAASSRKTADAVAVFATAPVEEKDADEGDDDKASKNAKKAETVEGDDGGDAKKGEGAVTAGAKFRVADVAGAGEGTTPVVPGSEVVPTTSRMVAAPNLPSVNAGAQFNSLQDVANAAERVFATHPRGAAAGGQYIKTPVMYLERDFPAELRIGPNATAEFATQVFDHAADLNRIGGQEALVAAAGWCAPSQIDYALMELEGTAGLLDLPEVQIARGGIQFTTGPDFSTIFGGTGYFHQTEAQVIAATTKPCMVIPCPTFTEKRLEVEGVCITGAFLQDRGYPEMVARFVRGAMKAHVRKLNIFKINQLVAGSTLFDYTNVANLPVTTSEYKDLSTVNRLLAILDIQAMDYRYKYRMDPTALMEGVLPYWLIVSIRADISRRMSLSLNDAETVTVAMFNSWAADRNIRLQWIYDWQDVYNTTNTSIVGQTAGIYTMPTSVEALLYAPGTWVAGVSDVIRLDSVYDSTNLALNQYTQLFTEEGILVAKRGFESRRIRTAISPSGTLSATTDMRTG